MKTKENTTLNQVTKSLITFYKFNFACVAIILPIYIYGLRTINYNLVLIGLLLLFVCGLYGSIVYYTKLKENLKNHLIKQYPNINHKNAKLAGLLFLSPIGAGLAITQLILNKNSSHKVPFILKNIKTSIILLFLIAFVAPFLNKHTQILSTISASYIGKNYQEGEAIYQVKKEHRPDINQFDSLSTTEFVLVNGVLLSELSSQMKIEKSKISESEYETKSIYKLHDIFDKTLNLHNRRPYLLTLNPLMILTPAALVEASVVGTVDIILQAVVEAKFIAKANQTFSEDNFKKIPFQSDDEKQKFLNQMETYKTQRNESKYMKRFNAYQTSYLSELMDLSSK
ncbi:MAG: hypothetical protein AB7I27_14540 [Bacteriovoracaceae bacterium]